MICTCCKFYSYSIVAWYWRLRRLRFRFNHVREQVLCRGVRLTHYPCRLLTSPFCPLLWRQCLWLYWRLLQELLYKALCSWRLQHPPRHLGHKIILTYLHCRGNLLCTLAMIMITRFHTYARPNLSIFFIIIFHPLCDKILSNYSINHWIGFLIRNGFI